MSYAITSPFPSFNDTDGSPLNNGNVYVGSANLNPVTDPIPVYWDEALTQPAAQPVRTINGYLSRNGSPGRLYTGFVTYSIRVTNNKGVQVFSDLNYKDPSSNAGSTYQQVITAISGQTVFNLSRTYIPGTNNLFVYRNGLRLIAGEDYTETGYSQITLTAGADNGDEFVFDIGYNYDTAANIDAQDVTYKLPAVDSVFTNVEEKLSQIINVKDFGAVGDGTTDDTAAFTAAAAYSSPVQVSVPVGTYLLNSSPVASSSVSWLVDSGATFTGAGSIGGSSGRYLPLANLSALVTVTQFGAVGDGIADDTAAIQSAIDYVASLPRGGSVYYPSGRYLVTSPLTVQTPYVNQRGDGIFSSLIVTNTDINTMIIGSNPIESLEGVDVVGIGFYHSNAVGKTKPHLTLISVEQSVFNVWIGNGRYGIVTYGGQGITFDRVFAPGNYVSGSPTLNSAEGIMLRSASEAVGYTLGATAVDLPTEVNFNSIYINGPSMAGWQYGVSIYAGEHITFSGDFYVGQSTVNNVHIEQQATNKLILEVKLEKGGYIDAAGTAGIWIGGPSGNGSQYIGSVSIACDVKGQSGDGLKGIYIDGTSRGGSFPQAVRNLSLTGNVSGFRGNGIEIGGGVNIDITGVKAWGNSFLAANQGSGLVLGPSVTVCNVTGGHFGGGTYGDGTGNQTYGISVDNAAFRVTLNGVDLRGNQAALNWSNNADTRQNQVFNCAGFNGGRAAAAPSMAASATNYTNPFGSPAAVLIFGGTVSSIKLNGTQMFSTTVNAPIPVGINDVLNVTYTVAPSWVWWPQ
jgi:hypothetical protein